MFDFSVLQKKIILLLLTAVAGQNVCATTQWYVSPSGKMLGKGTEKSPWDLVSTLEGKQSVSPADVIRLLEGNYYYPDRNAKSKGFSVRLQGKKDKPIHITAFRNHRATIDGGLRVRKPAKHLRFWNLEILVSENFSMPQTLNKPGTHPDSYKRPWGGVNIDSGDNRKFINLLIFNWSKKPFAEVWPAPFLKKNDHYRLVNPKDFFGKPFLEGVFENKSVSIPVDGEFAAFVIMKTPSEFLPIIDNKG